MIPFEICYSGASDLAWVFHRPPVLLHARPNAKVADTEDEDEVLVDDVGQDDFEHRMEDVFREEEGGAAGEDVAAVEVVDAAVPEGVDSKTDVLVNHDVPSGSGYPGAYGEEDDSAWKDFQG